MTGRASATRPVDLALWGPGFVRAMSETPSRPATRRRPAVTLHTVPPRCCATLSSGSASSALVTGLMRVAVPWRRAGSAGRAARAATTGRRAGSAAQPERRAAGNWRDAGGPVRRHPAMVVTDCCESTEPGLPSSRFHPLRARSITRSTAVDLLLGVLLVPHAARAPESPIRTTCTAVTATRATVSNDSATEAGRTHPGVLSEAVPCPVRAAGRWRRCAPLPATPAAASTLPTDVRSSTTIATRATSRSPANGTNSSDRADRALKVLWSAA